MKTRFLKNKKFKKTVALWIVSVLMLTPFVDTAGHNDGAKALIDADTAGPTVTDAKLQFSEDGTDYGDMPVSGSDDSGVYHVPAGYYKLSFKAEDEGNGLVSDADYGIKVKKDESEITTGFTISKVDEVYSVVFQETILDSATSSEIKVTISDAGGYECNDNIMGAYAKLQMVDDTQSWETELVDKDDKALFAESGVNLPKVNSGDQYTLRLSYKSADKISDVALSWNRNATDENVSLNAETNNTERDKQDGLYRNTYSVRIPSDVNASEVLKNLKVTYKYKDMSDGYADKTGDKAILSGDAAISYDAKPPVVKALTDNVTLQKSSDDGSSWSNVPYSDKNVYLDENVKYRYAVTASDVDTGIDKVYLHKAGASDTTDFVMTLEDSMYVYDITSLLSVDGAADYSAYAVDKAGNKSDSLALQKVQLIDTVLSIDKVELLDENGRVVSDAAGSIVTNKNRSVRVTASSGYEITKITLVRKNKDNNDSSIVKTDMGAQTRNDEGRYVKKYSFDIPSGSELTEWFRDVKIKVEDGVNEPKTEALGTVTDILYDKEAPEVRVPVVSGKLGELEVSTDGTNWEPVAAGDVKNGIYYTDPDKQYRYKVNVSEDGSGIRRVFVSGISDNFDEEAPGVYVLNITPNTTQVLDYKVQAEDKAGNTSAELQLQKVKQTNVELTVDAELRLESDSSVVDYDSKVLYTNKKYAVYVTVLSGFPVEKVVLYRGAESDAIVRTFEESDNTLTDQNQYKVTCKFDIPTNISDNEEFKSMYVSAADSNNQTANSTTIRSVVYDCSKPMYTLLSDEISDGWVNSYLYRVKFTSGDKTVEAPLQNVKYTISGSVADKANQSVDVSGMSATNDINVPCSNNINGTRIAYAVNDAAGNLKEYTELIKVDDVAPNGKLLVNNISSHSKPLKSAPDIEISYDDNLTIDKVIVRVVGPDGTVKEKTVASSLEQQNIKGSKTYSLSDIYGNAISNGKYKVSLIVRDKAGNQAKVQDVEFTYDNIRPIVSKPDRGTLLCSEDGGNTWDFVDISTENTLKGVYYTNPDYLYKYAVLATDVGSGFGKVYATVDGKEKKFSKLSVDGEIYYAVDIAPEADEILTYEVTAVDNAGNYAASAINTQKVILSDRTFKLQVKVYDKNDKVINPKNLPKYITTSGYRIRVSTSSGYEIKSITLARKNGEGKSDNLVYTSFDEPYNIRDVKNRYSVVLDIDIPTDVDINEWFASSYIVVKDYNSENNTLRYPESGRLIDVMYDITKPIIDAEATTDWVKKYNFKYTVESGDMGADESPLDRVSFTFSNSVDNEKKVIELDGKQSVVSGHFALPESAEINGTHVVIRATDKAGNTKTFKYNVKIDSTLPTVSAAVDGKKTFTKPLASIPDIKVDYGDNLSISTAKVTVKGPDGVKTKSMIGAPILSVNIDNTARFSLTDIYGAEIPDGDYTLDAVITDKAGNRSKAETISFSIDRTKPVISSRISDGVKSPKTGRFYSTDVDIKFTLKEMSETAITVLDNDVPVDVEWTKKDNAYSGLLKVTAEGSHRIEYSVVDAAGNKAKAAAISFTIDKTKPVISATVNGTAYKFDSGAIDLNTNADIKISINDINADLNDISYRVSVTRPDAGMTVSQFTKTSGTSFSFTEEGDYVFEVYTVDKANNKSDVKSISFRVDNTTPVLTITGAENKSLNHKETVTFSIDEAFWQDTQGSLRIYRRAGDGQTETLYKTIDIKTTSKVTSVTETIEESGAYRFELSANDRAGHKANMTDKLSIDVSSPEIKVSVDKGLDSSSELESYGKVKASVGFTIEITDDFYSDNEVTIRTAKRLDADEKEEALKLSAQGMNSSLVTIPVSFEEDGVYDIEIVSKDAAGNETEYALNHFILDQNAPDVSKVEAFFAENYNGKKLQSFKALEDIDNMVKDISVCECQVLLNGSEYDGSSKLEDGSYVLDVTVTDELGFVSEIKGTTFEIDTKKPKFIVVGVEDRETKEDTYEIEVSMQLDEDMLTSVTLNGENVAIENNTAKITVDTKGKYELTMAAEDGAGNKDKQTISFRYGKKTSILTWIIIILVILALLVIIFIGIKKKSTKENN